MSRINVVVLALFVSSGTNAESTVNTEWSTTPVPPIRNPWLSCPFRTAHGQLSIQEKLLSGQPHRPIQHLTDLDHYPTEDVSHTYGRRSTVPPFTFRTRKPASTIPRYPTFMYTTPRFILPTPDEDGGGLVHVSERYSLTADVELLRYTSTTENNPEQPDSSACGESDCTYTASGFIKLNQRIIKDNSVIGTVRGREVVDINKRTTISLCLSSPVNQELILEVTITSSSESSQHSPDRYQEAEDQYSRDRYGDSRQGSGRLQHAAYDTVKKFDCVITLPSEAFQEGFVPQWQTPRCSAHPSFSGRDSEELLFRYVVYQTGETASDACVTDNVQAGDWMPLPG